MNDLDKALAKLGAEYMDAYIIWHRSSSNSAYRLLAKENMVEKQTQLINAGLDQQFIRELELAAMKIETLIGL